MQIVDRKTQLATYFSLADDKGSAIFKSMHGLYDLNISNFISFTSESGSPTRTINPFL